LLKIKDCKLDDDVDGDYKNHEADVGNYQCCTKREVVSEYAKDQPIFLSIFQRNATFLVRKLQKAYHVCLVAEIRVGFGTEIRVATGAFGVELRAGIGDTNSDFEREYAYKRGTGCMLWFENMQVYYSSEDVIAVSDNVGEENLGPVSWGADSIVCTAICSLGWRVVVRELEMIRVEMVTYQLRLASHALHKVITEFGFETIPNGLSYMEKARLDVYGRKVADAHRMNAYILNGCDQGSLLMGCSQSHKYGAYWNFIFGAVGNSQRVISEPNVADTSLNQNSTKTQLHPNTEK
ncbi:hypothetical protein Tco_1142300, partial [Tanacetum coccineum]